MTKKIKITFFILFSLLACILLSDNKTLAKERLFSPMVIDESGEVVEEPLKFTLTGKEDKNKIEAVNDEGYLDFHVKDDVSYNATLEENEKYVMKNFDFTLKDGTPYRDDNKEIVYSFDVFKKKEEKPVKEVKRTSLYLEVLDGKSEVSDNLTFEFKSSDEKIVADNNEGQVGAKLKQDTSYKVSLLANDKYTLKDFSFKISKGEDGLYWPYREDTKELLVSLDLNKKQSEISDKPKEEDCGCDDSKQIKVKIKPLKIVDEKNPKEVLDKEEFTFVFFNVSKQKPAGEYTSINGKLPEIEMVVDDEYEVYLKQHDNYGMRHRHIFAFMNHYPIDLDDPNEHYIDSLELIKKDENYIEPKGESVPATMQVKYNGKILKEPLTFEFVSNNETVTATSDNGLLKVNLRENADYMVGLVKNDKYDIETFPIVIKNKQIGKFPYDHRTCYLVEYLNVVDKGSVVTTNPHYTIATKDEKVRISGMDFKDLKLEVNELDPNKIPALKGLDATVYDINLINIYRNEIVRLTGDFTVTVPKQRDKKVKEVYYINDIGKLEKRATIEGLFNSVITFKTDHFSRYALVYETAKEFPKAEKGEPLIREELPEYKGILSGAIVDPLVEEKPEYRLELVRGNSEQQEKVGKAENVETATSQYKKINNKQNKEIKLPNTGVTESSGCILVEIFLLLSLVLMKKNS